MEVTDVTISLLDEEKLRAFVNVVLDGEFVIHGLKVIRGRNGFFVSMPSRRLPDGTYRDIAHPITSECRQRIEKAVLEEYEKALKARSDKTLEF